MIRDANGTVTLPRARRGRCGFLRLDEVALLSQRPVAAGGAAGRLRLLRVHAAWGRAVGPQLRCVARPQTCRDGGLVVEVRDAGWKRELDRLRPEILARLGALLPADPIRAITFRVRPDRAGWALPAAGRGGAGGSPPRGDGRPGCGDLRELAAPLQRVGDAGLRRRLTEVMARYLGAASAPA